MNPNGPVIGLGQASIDYLGVIDGFPEPDTKCELNRLTIQGGGPVATALVTVCRLGLPAAFISAVGDDDFGRYIRQGLMDEDVDVSRLHLRPGATSQAAFITVEPKAGRRTIFWHPGDAGDPPPECLDPAFIASGRLLHLDGLKHKSSMRAARLARQAGLPVVFDAGTLREGSLELAGLTDVLICSEKFFAAFQPDGDVENGLARLRERGPRQTVATFGAKGSVGFDGQTLHRQPAYAVDVLDTTGAGDVYHGAYIYGLVQGWAMADCMRFASAVAAMKCRVLGGRTGIPRLEAVRDFMGTAFPV